MKTTIHSLVIAAVSAIALAAPALAQASCSENQKQVRVSKMEINHESKQIDFVLVDAKTGHYHDNASAPIIAGKNHYNQALKKSSVGDVVCYTKLPDHLEIMSRAY